MSGAVRGGAILDGPCDLPGLCIERHERRVGLLQENLAVAVREPAIHRVAAHDGNRVGVLIRRVRPVDRLVGQVDRVHLVRKRCVYVQRVADDERTSFVTAQHTGRERPHRLEACDVALVDLRERAVARAGVVAATRRPVVRVIRELLDLFVGSGERRQQQCEG
jgi:hypothetical protein